MSRWKPWLVLAVIFLAGGVTGAALTVAFGAHFLRPPGAQQMKARWMAHLTQKLNLTADQQAKIEPILSDAGNQIQSVHREEVGRMGQIMQKTHDQLAAILTPEQQTELAKMEKEHAMKPWGEPHGGMKPHDDGGPPPPPPGPPAPPPVNQ